MLSQEVAGDLDAGLAPGWMLRVCRRKENPAGIPTTHPQERNGFLGFVFSPCPITCSGSADGGVGLRGNHTSIPTVMSTCCRDATPSLVLSAFSCSRLGAAQRVVEICSGGLEPAPEIKSRQLWGGC